MFTCVPGDHLCRVLLTTPASGARVNIASHEILLGFSWRGVCTIRIAKDWISRARNFRVCKQAMRDVAKGVPNPVLELRDIPTVPG